jgi:hypothetical protein
MAHVQKLCGAAGCVAMETAFQLAGYHNWLRTLALIAVAVAFLAWAAAEYFRRTRLRKALALELAGLITRNQHNVNALAATGCKDAGVIAEAQTLERDTHGWLLRNAGAAEATSFMAAPSIPGMKVGMRATNAGIYQRAAGKLRYLTGLQRRFSKSRRGCGRT